MALPSLLFGQMESSKTSSSDPDASSSLSKLDSSSLDSSLSSSSSKKRRGPCQQGSCCSTNCRSSQQSITREQTVQRIKIIKAQTMHSVLSLLSPVTAGMLFEDPHPYQQTKSSNLPFPHHLSHWSAFSEDSVRF